MFFSLPRPSVFRKVSDCPDTFAQPLAAGDQFGGSKAVEQVQGGGREAAVRSAKPGHRRFCAGELEFFVLVTWNQVASRFRGAQGMPTMIAMLLMGTPSRGHTFKGAFRRTSLSKVINRRRFDARQTVSSSANALNAIWW